MFRNMQFVKLVKQIIQFLWCHVEKKMAQNIANASAEVMHSYYGDLTSTFLP